MQAVYEYPPKLSRAERQVKAAHDIEEHRKMQRNMYKNILLGVVIMIIGAVFASAVFAKVLLILLYTRIYEDHIEHSQRMGLSKSYLHICLYYEEVEKSYQTNKGRLVCVLKNVEKSSFVVKDKEGREKAFVPEDGMIALTFMRR